MATVATSALFQAIDKGDDIGCWHALRDGADLAAISVQGYSVMQRAAFVTKSAPEIVSFLLTSGAEVDAVGPKSSKTALHWAILGDRRDVARILVEHGAALEVRDSSSAYTALGAAACSSRYEVFRMLVEAGGNLLGEHEIDGDILTPFQIAVKGGSLDIVRCCLAECGLDGACRTGKERSLVQLAGKNDELKTLLRVPKTENVIQSGIEDSKPVQNAKSAMSGMAPI